MNKTTTWRFELSVAKESDREEYSRLADAINEVAGRKCALWEGVKSDFGVIKIEMTEVAA